MTGEQGRYRSYLLRLWRVQSQDQSLWRASLEDALTGERRGFAALDDLFAYLRQQTDEAVDGNGKEVDMGR